ncbi:hypothetical protein [Bacillus solitudinis]|uniref:hypothetical protein n=1 Tax=Bacillus solitudinis TaxID=2014074 RepID=UPI000C234385|nr:hypothetical protein [Bacillus solitudinis]
MNINDCLEEKLRNFGISSSYIQFLKEEVLEVDKYSNYYDVEQTESLLVPVNDIVALGMRGVSNCTWWEHATYEVGDLENSRMSRFEENNNLSQLRIDQISAIFASDNFADHNDAVKLNFYQEEGKYFVTNGNHRVMWAKLLNIPFIKSKVTHFTFNPEQYENYMIHHDLKMELQTLLKCNQMYVDELSGKKAIFYKGILVIHLPQKKYMNYSDAKSVELACSNITDTIGFINSLLKEYKYYVRIPAFIRLNFLKFKTYFTQNAVQRRRLKLIEVLLSQ